jgi:AcrR family transcriptional regulator
MVNKARRPGRPPGHTHIREDILDVARRRFLNDGYERVTMRSIATEAGVDAALISYHFGSKRGLFGATMQLTANPPEVLADALAGPLSNLPHRLLRTVLSVWDDTERGAPLRAFATAAVYEPDVARLFREMAEREMITRIAERIGGPDASRRAAVATSQIAGLVFVRYVLRLEPLASMPADELAMRAAPSLGAALAGPRSNRRMPT